ncbi:unnamed protein product [Rhizophagus irregularis]|nr:unnamed protein product [Rhizophagus irregularis]
MILCMTNEQAAKCIEFKYFEVNLSFKRVYGDINEFEFNAYEEKSRTILAFYIIFTNIATKEKSCCIYYIRIQNMICLKFLKQILLKKLIKYLDKIKMRNEDGIQSRGWKHNECIYKRIKIHQQTGIHMSSKDRSDFGKKCKAIKDQIKKATPLQKKAKIDYDDDDTEMEIEEAQDRIRREEMQFKQNEIDLKLKELQIKKSEMELNNNQ